MLCSWARYYTLIVPLSTQVHKWYLLTNAGDKPAIDLHPILVAECYGNQDKIRSDGPLGSTQTLPTLLPYGLLIFTATRQHHSSA